jgi:hypothetical protein
LTARATGNMLAGMGIVVGFLKLFGLCGVLSLLACVIATVSFVAAVLKRRFGMRPLLYSIAGTMKMTGARRE